MYTTSTVFFLYKLNEAYIHEVKASFEAFRLTANFQLYYRPLV